MSAVNTVLPLTITQEDINHISVVINIILTDFKTLGYGGNLKL